MKGELKLRNCGLHIHLLILFKLTIRTVSNTHNIKVF